MIKITSKLLIATVLITGLAACKTTQNASQKGATFIGISGSTVYKSTSTIKTTEVKSGDYVKIEIDGKEYKLNNTGLGTYSNKSDMASDKIIDVNGAVFSGTSDADLSYWVVGSIDRATSTQAVVGIYYTGNKTEKMPTTSSATYKGAVGGGVMNRTTGESGANLTLDFDATVNFENNNFVANIGETTGGGSFDVTNEAIDSNGFSFTATSDAKFNTEGNLNESLISDISGSFYGSDADLMAGTGFIENSTYIGFATVFAEKQ